jgi:hypothetical protein
VPYGHRAVDAIKVPKKYHARETLKRVENIRWCGELLKFWNAQKELFRFGVNIKFYSTSFLNIFVRFFSL